MLKDGNIAEQEIAAELLYELGPEASPAVAEFIALVSKERSRTVALLMGVLARIGPAAKEAVPVIKKKVADDNTADAFRISAAIALWRIARDPDAGKLLRARLSVRAGAGASITERVLLRIDPGPETVAALTKQLKSQNWDDILDAGQALGSRAKETVPALVKLLKSKEILVRMGAAETFAHLGPEGKDALEELRDAMND